MVVGGYLILLITLGFDFFLISKIKEPNGFMKEQTKNQ
jgi:hypothetical protein